MLGERDATPAISKDNNLWLIVFWPRSTSFFLPMVFVFRCHLCQMVRFFLWSFIHGDRHQTIASLLDDIQYIQLTNKGTHQTMLTYCLFLFFFNSPGLTIHFEPRLRLDEFLKHQNSKKQAQRCWKFMKDQKTQTWFKKINPGFPVQEVSARTFELMLFSKKEHPCHGRSTTTSQVSMSLKAKMPGKFIFEGENSFNLHLKKKTVYL